MSWVHDNIILSYNVDLVQEILVIKTKYHTQEVCEETDVIFKGLLTHDFKHVLQNSMIFDIQEYPIERFIKNSSELIEREKGYGWPFPFFDAREKRNKEMLMAYVRAKKYKVFEIMASTGLNGWVMAKQMMIIVNGELKSD